MLEAARALADELTSGHWRESRGDARDVVEVDVPHQLVLALFCGPFPHIDAYIENDSPRLHPIPCDLRDANRCCQGDALPIPISLKTEPQSLK